MIAGVMFILGVLVALVAGGAIAVMVLASNLLYICEPNEVLVFSGTGPRGYRIIKGGRGWRVPLIETVDRLDLTNMIIEVNVTSAYSKGGIPLLVQGIANVKVSARDPYSANAVERLLDKPFGDVMQIAKDTLEGNLRGVLLPASAVPVPTSTGRSDG